MESHLLIVINAFVHWQMKRPPIFWNIKVNALLDKFVLNFFHSKICHSTPCHSKLESLWSYVILAEHSDLQSFTLRMQLEPVLFKILIDQILTKCLALCLAAIQFLGASFSWCSAIHPFIWHPRREANGQQRDKSEMCLGKILHLLPHVHHW